MRCYKKLLIFFSLIVLSKNVCAMDIVPLVVEEGPIRLISKDLLGHLMRVLIADQSDSLLLRDNPKNLAALVNFEVPKNGSCPVDGEGTVDNATNIRQRMSGPLFVSKLWFAAMLQAREDFECAQNVFDCYVASQKTKRKFLSSYHVAEAFNFKKYSKCNKKFSDYVRCISAKNKLYTRIFEQSDCDRESKKLILNAVHCILSVELKNYLNSYMEKHHKYLDPNLIMFAIDSEMLPYSDASDPEKSSDFDSDLDFSCKRKSRRPFIEFVMLKNRFLPLSVVKFYGDNADMRKLSSKENISPYWLPLVLQMIQVGEKLKTNVALSLDKSDLCLSATPHNDAGCRVIQYLAQQCLGKLSYAKQDEFLKKLNHTMHEGEYCCPHVFEHIAVCGKDISILEEHDNDEMITDVKPISQKTTPSLFSVLQRYQDLFGTSVDPWPTLTTFIQSSSSPNGLYRRLLNTFAWIHYAQPAIENRPKLIFKLIEIFFEVNKRSNF
jgi:hypothetical protein